MAERNAPQHQDSPDLASETWRTLPWRKLEQHVYRIQKRIYRASQHGNQRAVQKLQKLLMKSEAARLLAVRRVTQENQGKKTAGVDGVKALAPQARLAMVAAIHPKRWNQHPSRPVRRVWIPKPGKSEQRPLGIPIMRERCKQALAKSALEPEWEARFEANSYGFRPGRSCHDAIEAVFQDIVRKPKYVLDADIKGAFDNINQDKLLTKLHAFPSLSQAINTWLKAGVMDGCEYAPTEAGTPQGGVISPLLMNVALHGMEAAISQGYANGHRVEKPLVVRYADDFVVFHSHLADIHLATERVTTWLADMGLTLSPKKTRITHTLVPFEGKVGFDFLGFSIRQYPVGNTHSGKGRNGKPLGFKTLIKPSQEAIQRHIAAVKARLQTLRSRAQEQVIRELSPLIRGWSAYYRTVVSSRILKTCDAILWQQLWQWAKKRHPHKGSHWIKQRYWQQQDHRNWVFTVPGERELYLHGRMKIQRHRKVKGTVSPYDGNLFYWSQRLHQHPLMHDVRAKLLARQQGKCRWCGLHFREEDLMETDHLDRNTTHNDLSNLMLLHRHCHDERHAKQPNPETIQFLALAGIHIT